MNDLTRYVFEVVCASTSAPSAATKRRPLHTHLARPDARSAMWGHEEIMSKTKEASEWSCPDLRRDPGERCCKGRWVRVSEKEREKGWYWRKRYSRTETRMADAENGNGAKRSFHSEMSTWSAAVLIPPP